MHLATKCQPLSHLSEKIMATADSSTFHVIENLSMFGFSNPVAAILQCVKELVENSLDSLIDNSSGYRGDVHINITGIILLTASR